MSANVYCWFATNLQGFTSFYVFFVKASSWQRWFAMIDFLKINGLTALNSLFVLCLLAGCNSQETTATKTESVNNSNSVAEPSSEQTLKESCEASIKYFEETKQSEEWQPLMGKLWINKAGEIGYETSSASEVCIYPYYLKQSDDNTQLKDLLDLTTLKHLAGDFFKDKNHVYYHRDMSGGGYFAVLESVDLASFEALGSCYAKDKNHIYTAWGERVEQVDYASFKASENTGCFAKDKEGYLWWADRHSFKASDPYEQDLKQRLDALK